MSLNSKSNGSEDQQADSKKTTQTKEFILSFSQTGKKIYTFTSFAGNPFIIDPDYELDIIKGMGTYGLVAAGRNLITGQQMAIKRISQVFDSIGDTKRILRQIKILKFLKHRNIVGLKDMMSIQDPYNYNEVYLCMEYMEYTLQRLIHSQQVQITQPMVQFILYQMLSAINFMHSADIIHRDIKPENVLINKKCQLKVADMNLARKQIASDEVTDYVTSRPYRAPQIFINNNTYTKAIDIWSIGCIFAELLGKTVLFQGNDFIGQLKRFVAILGKPNLQNFPDVDPIAAQGLARVFRDIPDRGKIDWKFLFPKASQKALDLLDNMLVYDAKSRFTADECLNHPFLQDFKNRPKIKCKQNFDFSFDKIQSSVEKLRKAILQEVEIFQIIKKRKREPQQQIQKIQVLQKKVKTSVSQT